MSKKVLVVATSRITRGGITSVVKLHEKGEQWNAFSCKWIQTHRDGSMATKLWYFFKSFTAYAILLPFYDLVHIHLSEPPSAKRKKLFMGLARLFNKKILLHFHLSDEKFLYDPNNFDLYRGLFTKADLVLVLSEQWRRWINDSLKLTEKDGVNMEVLYNPCSEVNRVEDRRENRILYAGTIMHRKRYADLIEGFALIANKYPDWKVAFAGNGEIEKAKALVAKRNIEQQIEFLGWVKGEAKDAAFQRASIYCLASEGEGFPMAVLDAWSYGIPCVMTPVGGIPDIVDDGKQGLIFPVGDTQCLAEKLEQLILDHELRKTIVAETDKFVYGTFSVDVVNRQLGDIYTKLLGADS